MAITDHVLVQSLMVNHAHNDAMLAIHLPQVHWIVNVVQMDNMLRPQLSVPLLETLQLLKQSSSLNVEILMKLLSTVVWVLVAKKPHLVLLVLKLVILVLL
jgi:hypothetical protein